MRPPCSGVGPACFQDIACGAGGVCEGAQFNAGTCIPACTSDESCGEGLRCSAEGHCVRKSCQSDGYVCPARSHCSTGATEPAEAVDSHGCVHDACASDAECGGAFCLNGRCYPVPGRCLIIGCA